MDCFENQKLVSFIITISIIISSTHSSSSSSSSIYDVLRSYGLPMGLFPKGITTNFTIDPTTGRFEVRLDQPCDAKFETQVRYDSNVTGTLRYGQVGELLGVASQELFLWFPVKGIRVDVPSSGIVYFDVGVIDKQLSLSSFESPRDCDAVAPYSPPAELLSFDDHGRIVEKQSGKLAKELDARTVLRPLRAIS